MQNATTKARRPGRAVRTPTQTDAVAVTMPRIYYLQPHLAGPLDGWSIHLDRIARLGFAQVLVAWPFASDPAALFATTDLDHLHPALAHSGPVEQAIRGLVAACEARGMACLLDMVVDQAAAGGALATELPGCWQAEDDSWLDPRSIGPVRIARPDFTTPGARELLVHFWQARLSEWQNWGIAGVRCHAANQIPLDAWRDILAPVRAAAPGWLTLGWMTGRPRDEAVAAADVFGCVPASTAWWDGRASWLVEEYRDISRHGRLLGCADDPFGRRLAERVPLFPHGEAAHRLALHAATALADGWMMPMGFEFGARQPFLQPDCDAEDFAQLGANPAFDLSAEITAANAGMTGRALGEPRLLSGEAGATLIYRRDDANHGRLVALNPDLAMPATAALDTAAARIGRTVADAQVVLPPGGGAVVTATPCGPVIMKTPPPITAGLADDARIAIETVSPTVEAGRFAAKRIVGEVVTVEADIFADGHEVLGAELRWRAADAQEWSTARMAPLVNDRWSGTFTLLRPGRHEFAIEAWWDHFATFRRDLGKKRDAGLTLDLEIAEGRLLLEQTLPHAAPPSAAEICAHLARLDQHGEDSASVLLSEPLRDAMQAADPRRFATGRTTVFPIEADREAAGFASWYELFPRSQSGSRTRHGTFDDVIARLPAIRDMGFDVLYFPPIHPIGLTNRKGPNNTLTPGPDDYGSPYAIGSAEGGHEAIHPLLGSREDFRRMVREAARHGLELALDFAIQCSPDHPWLTAHPDWFQWRPDGSMKYAENPPKKYQDIVNVEFYGEDARPGLWLALRDVVQGWVDEGVRIFRVDNPHTKPFPFWEWLIADIRARDPGVLFLAEAFTRPKVMYRLGKVGFSQSYTYFTWRNEKAELAAYLTELNTAPVRDLFRPNFFVNTPDINPIFLQNSGRPGFLIRAALATTLSGLWGMYSGFELCEAAALPGREEYLDSEKYELRPRDWAAPGNIVAEITRLNTIRRSRPALQSHLGVTFLPAANDRVLFYAKRAPGERDMILVAVSLDPHATQSAAIEVPLWDFGLPDEGRLAVEDLMTGARFDWVGKHQTITLDPTRLPFSIWRVAPYGGN